MKLGHAYVRAALDDPELRAIYDAEARACGMRVCDLVMSDFLTDPVIVAINADKYQGRAGDSVIVDERGQFHTSVPDGTPLAFGRVWPRSRSGSEPEGLPYRTQNACRVSASPGLQSRASQRPGL
jgi:hypothetical protein